MYLIILEVSLLVFIYILSILGLTIQDKVAITVCIYTEFNSSGPSRLLKTILHPRSVILNRNAHHFYSKLGPDASGGDDPASSTKHCSFSDHSLLISSLNTVMLMSGVDLGCLHC